MWQHRKAVFDDRLSPGFGWALGGMGLEMEHVGTSNGDVGTYPEKMITHLKGCFHLPHLHC